MMVGIMDSSIPNDGRNETWVEIPTHPSGIYSLIWKGKVVYIGKSTNVLGRIAAHRNRLRRWRASKKVNPTEGPVVQFDRVFVRFCAEADLDRLEYAMINKYRPPANIALLRDEPLQNFRLEDVIPCNKMPSKPSAQNSSCR